MSTYQAANHRASVHQARVVTFLRTLGYTVEDVSTNKDYFERDIDFIISKGTERATVEFKADAQVGRTGNLALEVVSNAQHAKPGCFLTTAADWLYVLDTHKTVLICARMAALRHHVLGMDTRGGSFGKAFTQKPPLFYTSVSLLVPVSTIKHTLATKDFFTRPMLSVLSSPLIKVTA